MFVGTAFMPSENVGAGFQPARIIAIPLTINCRDGIYAVRAKTYECNDRRHKCRPYEPISSLLIPNFLKHINSEFFSCKCHRYIHYFFTTS